VPVVTLAPEIIHQLASRWSSASQEHRPEILGELLGESLATIEYVVRRRLGQHLHAFQPDFRHEQSDGLVVSIVNGFIDEKMTKDDFVLRLADATSPYSFLAACVKNYATDYLSKNVDDGLSIQATIAADNETERVGETATNGFSPTEVQDGLVDGLDNSERLLALADALNKLSEHEVILLKVHYAADAPDLTESEVKVLARTRGVPTDQIRAELAVRSQAIEERDSALQAKLDRRYAMILRLHRFQSVVARIAAQLGDASETCSLSEKRILELRTPSALRDANPAERAAVLERCCRRLGELGELQRKDAVVLSRARAKNWGETAMILGIAGANPANLAKVTYNRIVWKLNRLVKG
jgi:hypothetical protein